MLWWATTQICAAALFNALFQWIPLIQQLHCFMLTVVSPSHLVQEEGKASWNHQLQLSLNPTHWTFNKERCVLEPE